MPPTTTETLLLPSGSSNAPVFAEPSDDHVKQRKATTEGGESQKSSIPKYDKIDDWRGEIRWPDLIVQIFLHAGAVYGLYLCFYVKYVTILWGECQFVVSLEGYLYIINPHKFRKLPRSSSD